MRDSDSLAALIMQIQRKAPEYVDLLTAETDEEFETAFTAVLGKAVSQLESQKTNFAELDEVGLTGALAMALSIPGLSVSTETHSNGHVDLMIAADHCSPARMKLGEAKIYNGYEYHVQGLEQLLGRYTTGREGSGLLISYVRLQNISGLMQKLRARMDAERPFEQTCDVSDHPLKWSFSSTHQLTSGDDHDVGHIACNMYVGG
jgi:hypothetical protein